MMDRPDKKFELIHESVSKEDNVLSITKLCRIANVSRSGYYRWVNAADIRQARERRDQEDFSLILQAYQFRGYAKGIRGIHIRLLHLPDPVVMNVKKSQRLMHKYGLHCPIRKANPYRRIAKSIRTNTVADNLLNWEFEQHGPRKVLLTDITYIPYHGVFCYLSTILDAYTKQVLAYVLSPSLELDFVLETVHILIQEHSVSLDAQTLVHSDQGCHYTGLRFIQILKDSKSMSRKGNCWDNAPQESFFGHMKDEIDLSECESFDQVKAVIDDWIDL